MDREQSIWIPYCPMPPRGLTSHRPGLFNSHHRLATPVSPWERLKIGGGIPPILTKHGWMVIYHGVSEMPAWATAAPPALLAGVMVLSKDHPRVIRYRSVEPVLTPVLPQERQGTIADVVFPTGIDRRDDLGLPDRFDVYYGMADNRIGVARLDLPDFLPPGGVPTRRKQSVTRSISRIQSGERILIMKPNADQPNAPDAKPGSKPEAKDDLKSLPLPEVEKKLGSSPDGLSQAEAQKRLTQYGPNEIEEKKTNPFLKFLYLFLGSHPVDDRGGGDSVGRGPALAGFLHHPPFAGGQRRGRILGRTRRRATPSRPSRPSWRSRPG